MRTLLQIGYRLRAFFLRRLRIRTRGVKVMLFNRDGELLLIRNGYGQRHLWVLPGGGVGRGEAFEAAAARELREEVGIDPRGLSFVSEHRSGAEGKRDTIQLFSAVTELEPEPDGREVEEARFFPLDSLPADISSATLRRIAEHRGERTPDDAW